MQDIRFRIDRSSVGPPSGRPLEVWGGIEYTHNRVRSRYFDQMDLSGHLLRPRDCELIAELGITSFRFGLLWERYEKERSWRTGDAQFQSLIRSGMRPIAGLMHHGSGPPHTSLIDPEFPKKLARYASMVAERYPALEAYTPVNEPNTTARFSGMYGVWYPHHRTRKSFLRALLNQVKGTVLSMKAIRNVRSDAKLVQTDDTGRVCGTDELRATWELLNARQWLSFDLLCGLVDRQHPLFTYMVGAGLGEREILWFQDNPCPPDVIGLNYYTTSDRFLDHRCELYPEDRRSAEGPFADVEAVRVRDGGLSGVDTLLRDAWRRYRIPVAITEVHLGGPADEQIRWITELWQAANRVRHEGVECIAFTLWAMLGSFYWNQLVTQENGHYEPGVFDIRSGAPVPTELTDVIAQIARGEAPSHPALRDRGWWRREDCACFPLLEEFVEEAA